jgi:predicted N-acyltransferase
VSPSERPDSNENAYELRVIERVREVAQQDWDALVGDDSSPFVEWTWLDTLEETGCVGGDSGWVPAHLSLWRGKELVAVAPSYLKGHSEGEFVFDWSWADLAERLGVRYYPKVVVAVPFTPATGDRVLVAPGIDRIAATGLVAKAAREWCKRAGASSVHLLFASEPEAQAWQDCGYLRRDGFQFHWFRDGARTWDDYLARFSSKQRNQIKRELRGIADRGIVVETLSPEAHSRELARRMHGFYASTIDKHGVWGRLYLNLDFFERIVERFRDRLAWVVARDSASGEIIGGAFNVARGKRLYGRYWGAADGVDVPYLHFVVCYYEGIRACIERGLDVFEPGAGGEHKRARGFVPTLTRSAHWLADARLRSVLAPWLARERERVAAIVEAGDDLTRP